MSVKEDPNDQLRQLLTGLAVNPRNEQLWEQLYQNVRSFVFAVAYRALNGNQALASDVTQQTFLRLFQYGNFSEVSDPQDFFGYLATIARNVALDLRRKENRYATGLDLTLCDLIPGTSALQGPERVSHQLRDLVDDLRGEERVLAELIMQGMSLSEIGENLHLSYTAAAVRVHRLRKKLSKLMK